MHHYSLVKLCGVLLLLCIAVPAARAVTPLWSEPATLGGELSGVVISEDQSTIVAGGDQLIVLSRNGEKCWTAWGGDLLDISRDGSYILIADGRVVRLISGDTGTLFWEQPLDTVITDISLAPDASAVAATGGGQVRTMTGSGEAIASNTSMAINHIRITPSGKQILITTSRNVQLSNLTLQSRWSDTSSVQNLVEIAPDESSFVTATNNRVRMYNGSGGLVWDQKLPGGNALALAYSRDGSTIVIGMDDSNVRVMNRSGALLWTANATNWITSVAVSDDGNTIAAGSLDKKLHVFNHAGKRLGIFTAKSSIDFHSAAVTGDGSLIVVVDQTAVYGLSRSAFIPEETVTKTITSPSYGMTVETTMIPPSETTTRKVTPNILTLPTHYPTSVETPATALPPAVPLLALGLLLLCRPKKR
jgi:WD40 repeat protein